MQDPEIVIVRRRQGGDVALVGADELEGLLETAHLLRSPRHAARLLSARERARCEGLPATSPRRSGRPAGHLSPQRSGVCSRRITQEHRGVDLLQADWIEFPQGRYHDGSLALAAPQGFLLND